MLKQAEQLAAQVRPVGSRVLAKRVEAQEQRGGIILPDTAKKKEELARVLAVGPGKPDDKGQIQPMPVKVGDLILMDRYAGQEISLEGEEFLIVRADDIVAIIEE